LLTLVAASYDDGWGFVEHDNRFLLIKPPYLRAQVSSVTQSVINKAIEHYGFSVAQETFEDWADLVRFMKTKFLERRRTRDSAPVGDNVSRDLIASAPPYILENYLRRIEEELIPQQEWQAALDILITLIDVDAVKHNQQLSHAVARLIKLCLATWRQNQQDKEALLEDEEGLEELFPESSKRYGVTELCDSIQEVQNRQTVWA
jgi:hypothetical protein